MSESCKYGFHQYNEAGKCNQCLAVILLASSEQYKAGQHCSTTELKERLAEKFK